MPAKRRSPAHLVFGGVIVKTIPELIEDYTPIHNTEHWHVVGPFVRDVVRAFAPMTYDLAKNAIGAVNVLAHWAVDEGLPLEVETVLHPDTVERHCLIGSPTLSKRSRADRRALLVRIGRAVTRTAPWPPEAARYPRMRIAPPYSPVEVDRLWDIAGQQPNAYRTRTAYAVLSVGLGAGLSPAEHQLITGTDVETRDGIVLIHVPGKYARTVPVLNRYAPKVAELAEEHPDVPLLASSITDSRNRLNSRISRICLPPGLPNITCARLRTTWAATVLGAGVPLKEFMALYGSVSTQTLGDLLPFLRNADHHAVTRLVVEAAD